MPTDVQVVNIRSDMSLVTEPQDLHNMYRGKSVTLRILLKNPSNEVFTATVNWGTTSVTLSAAQRAQALSAEGLLITSPPLAAAVEAYVITVSLANAAGTVFRQDSVNVEVSKQVLVMHIKWLDACTAGPYITNQGYCASSPRLELPHYLSAMPTQYNLQLSDRFPSFGPSCPWPLWPATSL